MTENIVDSIVERRIKFLLEAARHEVVKDQAISFSLRVVSNHATIGKDATSATIKKLNRRVSNDAFSLLLEAGLESFCRHTINEHPMPIVVTWNWLRENAEQLDVASVWKHFLDNKMITVTKDEDDKIRLSGQMHAGDFQSRYFDLGIFFTELNHSPADIWRTSKRT